MIDYEVDGVPLRDPAGRWWVTAEGSAHSPAFTRRTVDANVPGMSGIPDFGFEPHEASSLPLRVIVKSRDPLERERRWQAVKALFTQGQTFILGRKIGGVTHTTRAKLRSISEPELSARVGTIAGVITVTILDGVFHAAVSDFTRSLTAAFSAITIPALNGTAAVTDWKLRIRGPLSSVTLTDDSTGTGVSYAATLTAAEYLYIEGTRAWKVTSNTAWDTPAAGVDVSRFVSYPPQGLLRLTPRPINNDPMNRAAVWSGSAVAATAQTTVVLRAGAAYG